MRQSKLYIPTIKEVPATAEVKSHQLLLKAGYINQTAAGIYTYLPMATKVLQNIEKIVREELEKIGANEVRMPFLQSSDLWKDSGRWGSYGAELFRVKDRHDREFALAPTHEEVATYTVKNYLNSYKKFPLSIYQIQTKMRDERRPRFGLIRGREFIMMDAYTFDKTDAELKESYDAYYKAYTNIFDRLGLAYKIVKADNGTMGGLYSNEFMALSEIGEDFIAYESGNEIAYNVEIAPVYTKYEQDKEEIKQEVEFHTPNCTKIEVLAKEHNLNMNKLVKAVCYNVDDELVIAFVMGDKEVEEVKIANVLKTQSEIYPADQKILQKYNIVPGYIGIKSLPKDVKILIDNEIKYKKNLIMGANKEDYHLKNVNLEDSYEYFDIRRVKEGDLISEGGEPIRITKGIEIGHIFALGKKYTEALEVKYLTKDQKNETPTMGCYGIGISRILSTIVEQYSDENGLILPPIIAPYDVHIIPLDYNKSIEQQEFTNKIIEKLEKKNISYLLDDRDERPGIKFKDSDLIGIPKQIIIGKKYVDNIVEFKIRGQENKQEIKVEEVIQKIQQ